MNPVFRHAFILAALAAATLTACGKSETPTAVVPVEITQGTSCSLDGMLLSDYPGPKAQIHYAGQVEPDFFCDTVEMFHVYLNPEQVRAVRALFVQDMGKADWENPRDHWIDAKTAYYVYGSKREGSMGPTIGSFASKEDAVKFAARYGGKVYRFTDITPDMVVLDGGVLHDRNM
jgi:copper chaperone NosL